MPPRKRPSILVSLHLPNGECQRTDSQPFCRRLETKGFPDFKLHLAQSLANGTPYVNRNVEEDDSVAAYTGKILNRRWPAWTA